MSELKIDKGIPVPPVYGNGRKRKYPFAKMEIGDSVFVKDGLYGGAEHRGARSVAAYKGWKFSAHHVDGGLRIWRVE